MKSETLPKVRSGASFNSYKETIILFGGIHDITWELDDLYCFDIQK